MASPKRRDFSAQAYIVMFEGKRDGRIDLGIVYSKRPCTGAGVFTTNDVKAAPVLHGQAILAEQNEFHAIVANSGNANACTGPQGEVDTGTMASESRTTA